MWRDLPDELQALILDFYGDVSVERHRCNKALAVLVCSRFVRAELAALFLLHRHMVLRPSFIRRIEGFQHCLQLAHLQAQRKALLENHGGSGIP